VILTPKTISPGWAKRWTRQSVDLFRRTPALAIGIMTMFGMVNAVIPQPFLLGVPLTAFMMGILFSSLRAADHDSGHALYVTWLFFRQCARDIAHLARDVFIFMLVLGFFLGIAIFFYHKVTHDIGTVKPDPAYLDLPGWIRGGVLRESSMLILGIFLPGSLPLVFLTMSVGNQPLMHYVTGYRAAVMNWQVSYLMMGFMLACSFLPSILKEIPSVFLGYLLMVTFAVAFWWFGTWGYLWCREMFEGVEENAKETAKQTVHASAVA
jgi:hypothetical protein